MIQFNFKEDLMLIAIALILVPIILWLLITQPVTTFQSSKNETDHVKSENLKKDVYTITEQFSHRGFTDIETLNKTAEFIYKRFSQYTQDVSYQTYQVKDESININEEYRNVSAYFKGTESCSEGHYVIGGHYDTFAGLVGANDNTSAVAALLELARLLKKHPPKCDVQLVAYSLEEPPFFRTQNMGSYIHAKQLEEEKSKVKLAIILDMIGYYNDEENSQNYPLPLLKTFYPNRANFIALVSNMSWENIMHLREAKSIFKETNNLPVYSITAPSFIPGVDFSDHQNYWKLNYPAIFVTDTAFYRSDNYHTEHDKPETLDYERMAKVVESVFHVVR